MRKDNVDWKKFAEELLWRNIVHNKNEDSLYDIMLKDYPDRNIKRGDISYWRICSYVDPFSYKPLTWKELALELGLFKEHLTPDGHKCKGCPKENDCTAFFKYDEDHERCNWWTENILKKILDN